VILSAIWGSSSAEQLEYLRVFVGNLRRKLEPNPRRAKVHQDRTLDRLSL